MTVTMQVERLNPTTSNGEGVRVIVTYYSFNKTEIDELEDELREHNNSVTEVEMGWRIE